MLPQPLPEKEVAASMMDPVEEQPTMLQSAMLGIPDHILNPKPQMAYAETPCTCDSMQEEAMENMPSYMKGNKT